MSQQRNIETLKRFGEVVNNGELQELAQLVAPGVVEHDPVPGRGLEICRLEDGKIAERWGNSDVLGIMRQLERGPA